MSLGLNGKLIPAGREIKGFPRGIVTNATIVDDSNWRTVGFVVGLNGISPRECGLDRIAPTLGSGWKAFLDSRRVDEGLKWRFWAVIHRADVPREELEGRIAL